MNQNMPQELLHNEVEEICDRLLDSEAHAGEAAIPAVAEDAVEIIRRLSVALALLEAEKQNLVSQRDELAAATAYTESVGVAGQEYFESFGNFAPRTPGTFRWETLFNHMLNANSPLPFKAGDRVSFDRCDYKFVGRVR